MKRFLSVITAGALIFSVAAFAGCGSDDDSIADKVSVTSYKPELCEDYVRKSGAQGGETIATDVGDTYYYTRIAMQYYAQEGDMTVASDDFAVKTEDGIEHASVAFITRKGVIEEYDPTASSYDIVKTVTVTRHKEITLSASTDANGYNTYEIAFDLPESAVGAENYEVTYKGQKLAIAPQSGGIIKSEVRTGDSFLYMMTERGTEEGKPTAIKAVTQQKTTTHYEKCDEKTVSKTYVAVSLMLSCNGKVIIKPSHFLITADGKEYVGKSIITRESKVETSSGLSTVTVKWNEYASFVIYGAIKDIYVTFEAEAVPEECTVTIR